MTLPSPFSHATARCALFTGLLALAGFALTACSRQAPLPQITAQAAGHAITAQIAGKDAKVEDHADGARLGSEFGHVTIERTRMRIEGSGWVGIAEGAPVTLRIERGRTDVKAGNVSASQSVSY
jgi:hypothetical protein